MNPNALLRVSERPETAQDLRGSVATVTAVLGLAVGLALLASHLYCRRTAARYELSVWHEMFRRDRVPDAHLAYTAVRLTNGTVVEGVLWTFTPGADVTHRDLALTSPIYLTRTRDRILTSYDLIVVPGNEVRSVAIQYTPRSNPQPPP